MRYLLIIMHFKVIIKLVSSVHPLFQNYFSFLMQQRCNLFIGSNLGSGAYSTVVSAINNKDHTNVAVKIIKKRKLARKQWLSVYQEVTILKKLNHDNIIKIVDFYESSNAFYIVLGKDIDT